MTRPLVIAHRGASGYLPEHTAAAKAMAHACGADYIEQDVVVTRDGVLLVLHDIYLDYVTDVAECFPTRRRSDGHFYVIDFEYAEIAALRVLERAQIDSNAALFPRRFPRGAGRFAVSTLDEELELIAGLNRSTGRVAGVYAEIKDPRWHAEHGVDLAERLLQTLAAHGYRERESPAFVQCFDASELRRVRAEATTPLKLVQLVGSDDDLSPAGLREIARYADGIGPPYARLVEWQDGTLRPTAICRNAQALGLAVHAYTFRADQLPPYAADLADLLGYFFAEIGVDGAFCDHPDIAVGVRDALSLD